MLFNHNKIFKGCLIVRKLMKHAYLLKKNNWSLVKNHTFLVWYISSWNFRTNDITQRWRVIFILSRDRCHLLIGVTGENYFLHKYVFNNWIEIFIVFYSPMHICFLWKTWLLCAGTSHNIINYYNLSFKLKKIIIKLRVLKIIYK